MPIDRSELEAVLADLVRIDSRNPWLIPGAPGEAAVAAFVADRLRNLDVELAIDEVAPGRPNVVARWRGTGGGPTLGLNAHLDTVGDASWPDRSMEPSVAGDRMTGLGAADDKGHVALQLVLLEAMIRSGRRLAGDLLVAFTMDEEATSAGTMDLVVRHPMDAAIVVEPFGIGRAIVTHQGFGWLDVVVHGRAAHGSAPEIGIDAIAHAAAVVRGLDRLGAGWAAAPHQLNGATVYHASTIVGGSDYATYPASCTIGIEIGTQPGETIADRVREIEAIFDEIRRDHPEFAADVVVKLERGPFEARGHERLWAALDAATREVLGTALVAAGENAWMDAALMQDAGIPTVSVGASGDHFHAPDEWVSVSELVTVGDILERAIVGFCG
ncbi:MAG TPA: M20/M25/M40 family metallo-hydrolase [Patescibacteria group bacterium]|nr:M20/M25/M40 family metallo-hydrolase [Patescibacteria group bacterium]